MKKNVKRINESQLRAIVAESVKKVLNELDPRTYASIARKRAEQGNDEKSLNAQQHAINAWNDKYSQKDENNIYINGELKISHEKYRDMKDLVGNPNTYFVNDKGRYYDEYKPEHNHEYAGKYTFSKDYGNEYYGYSMYYNQPAYLKYYDNNHNFGDEGLDVANQMAQGTGNYVKGKGWQ